MRLSSILFASILLAGIHLIKYSNGEHLRGGFKSRKVELLCKCPPADFSLPLCVAVVLRLHLVALFELHTKLMGVRA